MPARPEDPPKPPPKTGVTARLTKAERLRGSAFMDLMTQVNQDVLIHVWARGGVPKEWHRIAESPTHDKMRITTHIDCDVVKFFKGMGRGYQDRMNKVLRTYMEGRLAKMIEGPDTTDTITQAEQYVADGMRRIEIGDHAEFFGELSLLAREARLAGEIELMRALVETHDEVKRNSKG